MTRGTMKIISPGVAVREAPEDVRRRRLARLICAAIVVGWCLTALVAALADTAADRNAWLLAAIGVVTGFTWSTRSWTRMGDGSLQVLLIAASLQATAASLAFDRDVIAAAVFALILGALAGQVARTPVALVGQTGLIVAGQLLAAALGPDRVAHALDTALVVSAVVVVLAAASAAVRVLVERSSRRRRASDDARVLHARLSEAISADPERLALITLDLDGIPSERLADLRAALTGQLREGDVLSGAGEAGLSILVEADGPGARALALRLEAAVAAYHRDEIGALNASIGIAVFPADGRTPDQLLASADAALAKRRAAAPGLRIVAPAAAS